jgi:hypothetical protein
MKILFLFSSLLVPTNGWSYQSLQRQANIMSQTRRDPIQMPTQTPMVPYKVSYRRTGPILVRSKYCFRYTYSMVAVIKLGFRYHIDYPATYSVNDIH